MRIIGIIFATWLLWLVVSQYLLCARYQFEAPVPFEGPVIFNPYDSVDGKHWVKSNFHAHAHAWEGVTNGHGTASDIHHAYDSLGYGIHCVSNYHHIDTTRLTAPSYLPAYEHGYNLSKTHQLVLGSSQVRWIDYVFPQSVHNKQHVLDNLSEWGSVVILNHPAIRNGYTDDDLAQLGGYECMEVLNPSATSTASWDAALSSGKRVFVAGNDDIHNVTEKIRLGEMCTFVHAPQGTGRQIVESLRAGRGYGVKIGKTQNLDSIPALRRVTVAGDSVHISMTLPAADVIVSVQNGEVVETTHNTSDLHFTLKPDHHYARAVFHYTNGTSVYLNPVFFTPASGYRERQPFVSWSETMFYRAMGVTVLSLWMLLLWNMLPRRPRQRLRGRKLALR